VSSFGPGHQQIQYGKTPGGSNSNKDVANRLNLSLHTVETHRWRIMEKMDLHSTAELVLSAVRRGMVT
jgi:DNA-binding NarL/FixJ family response regulator